MNSNVSVHQVAGVPNVLVDGFRFQINTNSLSSPPSSSTHTLDTTYYYILSHFHSDHYSGLTSSFNRGIILCTSITANLIINILHINPTLIHIINYHETYILPNKISITFLNANHCPGAAIILFKLPNGINHIHTGDMRYHSNFKLYPELSNITIDTVYLDTTYAHPKHTFLNQIEAINKITSITSEFLIQYPSTGLVLLSAYNLGKEKIIFNILDNKIVNKVYIDEDKYNIYSNLEEFTEDRLNQQFTMIQNESYFHIVKMGLGGSAMPYFKPNYENLEEYKEFLNTTYNMNITHVLYILPTGWIQNTKNNVYSSIDKTISIQLVPYSEHSNYMELKSFIKFIKPREIIPTVYKDEEDRHRILDLFRSDVNISLNKKIFIDKIAKGSLKATTSITQEVWTCSVCTYKHRQEAEKVFIMCAICCTSRYNTALPTDALDLTTSKVTKYKRVPKSMSEQDLSKKKKLR